MKEQRDRRQDSLFPARIFKGSIGGSGLNRVARYRDDAEQIHRASVGDIVIVVVVLVALMLGLLWLL